MLVSKLALLAAWWRFSLAAMVMQSKSTADCAEGAVPARSLLQHSGKTASAVQLHSDCDWQCYVNRYSDLQSKYGTSNLAAAEEHWYAHGQTEGRSCTCDAEQGTQQGKCLKFLHIPKNAGATMEEIRQVRQKAVEAEYGVNESLAGWGWGQSIMKTLQCADGDSRNEPCRLMDGAGHEGACPAFHVPPAFDPVVAAGYADCDTFCIVRHPLKRAISQHIFTGGACDIKSFEANMRKMAAELQSNPFVEDCHWVPQVHYTKYCQRVLRFENLLEDFDALMDDYGYPISAGYHKVVHHAPCDLGEHIKDISPEVMEWIEQRYKADFVEFDYSIS